MMKSKISQKKMGKIIVMSFVIVIILLGVGISLRIHLNNIVKESAMTQVNEEIEQYAETLQQQFNNDFQILKSFASFFEIDKIYENQQFSDILKKANEQNDFMTMMFFNQDKQGIIANLNQDSISYQSLSDVQSEI